MALIFLIVGSILITFFYYPTLKHNHAKSPLAQVGECYTRLEERWHNTPILKIVEIGNDHYRTLFYHNGHWSKDHGEIFIDGYDQVSIYDLSRYYRKVRCPK